MKEVHLSSSGLVLLSFVLPPESGERVSLCITVLLSVTVFQQLTATIMPSYGFPYLAQYYFATLIMTAISLLATTLILNVYHRNNRRVPWIIHKLVIDGLGRILFCTCHRYNYSTGKHESKTKGNRREVNHQNGNDQPSKGAKEMLKAQYEEDEKRVLKGGGSDASMNKTFGGMLMNTIQLSLPDHMVDSINDKMLEEEERVCELRTLEWMKVAQILDRFFLCLFLLILLVTGLVVFMRAPRFGLFNGPESQVP